MARASAPRQTQPRWAVLRSAVVPTMAGAAVVALAGVSAGVSGSWVFGLLVVAMLTTGAFAVARMSAVRYWAEWSEQLRIGKAAATRRDALVGGLLGAHQRELACLESIVEDLRRGIRDDGFGGNTPGREMIVRLDHLLLLFVDLGAQLQRTSRALARTADDPPTVARLRPADSTRESEALARQHRVGRLRLRARRRGRTEMDRLCDELRNIGEIVRLVHEQVFCAPVGAAELDSTVREALDDAEFLLGAHASVADWYARSVARGMP